MSFSERHGYKPIKNVVQIESMDAALRNGLWSLLKVYCWDSAKHVSRGMRGGYYLDEYHNRKLYLLCNSLWFNYFKQPLDHLSGDWQKVLPVLREYYFGCKWHEVYDFVEFVAANYDGGDSFKIGFPIACNKVLETEMSAYRFVNGVITQITDKQEVAEIENAIESGGGPVETHLRRSLELLSDRKSPDHRNSIKESISAVESFVAISLRNEKGTLGQLLKKLERDIGLHPALKTAFSNLYGYTSDEGGIRHALTEAGKVDFVDAKFMLVVCSSFINYVKGKSGGKTSAP